MGPSQNRDGDTSFEGYSYVIPVHIHHFPLSDPPNLPNIIVAQMFGKWWDLPKFVDALFAKLEFPRLLK